MLGDKQLPSCPATAEGESVTAFLCLFGMSDPPQRKTYFLLRICFVQEETELHARKEVWYKMERGSDILQLGGLGTPNVLGMPQSSGRRNIAPSGGGP